MIGTTQSTNSTRKEKPYVKHQHGIINDNPMWVYGVNHKR